jgi:tRNA threonylcarbamoyladenosine biosynthesis protein TsaB
MSVERKLLIIETSGRIGRVALAEEGRVLAAGVLDEGRRHARDLAPCVRDLLQERNWRPADVEAVLVSRGPGSYTGLRVGIMSAKAFAYATGCKLLGVDTFAAIALQSEPALHVEVIADAQQGRVYCQRFRLAGGLPAVVRPLKIAPVHDWLTWLRPGDVATGPALSLHLGVIPEGVAAAAAGCWNPLPESLLRLGLHRLAGGEADDPWKLEPLYHRPSSAEEKWASRSGQSRENHLP